MSYYITFDSSGGVVLCHYGIKGQKWGIRRFQNSDGSLTPEGKARAKAEYKADNKKAFELGKKATISGRALDKSNKNLSKRPMDDIEIEANKRIKQDHTKNVKEMKAHYNELIKKYGKDAILDIAYDNKGRLNERVISGKEAVAASLITLSSIPAMLLGSPVGLISFPKDANMKGSDYYDDVRRIVRKERDGG